jgi:hypothetical protein
MDSAYCRTRNNRKEFLGARALLEPGKIFRVIGDPVTDDIWIIIVRRPPVRQYLDSYLLGPGWQTIQAANAIAFSRG